MLLKHAADGLRAGISAYCHCKEAFGHPSAAHARNCPLWSQPFGQSYTSRLCQQGCARQNWGQDTCKSLASILKSQIPPAMARRVFSVLQLILFGEPLQAKPKQAQEPPARPKTPTNLFCRESPPGMDALRQHKQTLPDRGKAKPLSANSRASSPSENKALHSRVWAHRQQYPEPFALVQEDETMQAC